MPPYNTTTGYDISGLQPIYYKQPCYITEEEDTSDNFEKSLYRNSKVYCIVLGDQIKQQTKTQLNEWYTVSFKLVTEMGLNALVDTSSIDNVICCQLLVQKRGNGGYSYFSESSTTLSIGYRHYMDPWKNQSGAFDLQYRVVSTNNDAIHQGEFFICVFVENEQSLSLCIGPFQQEQQKQQKQVKSTYWEENNNQEKYNMYRAIPLVGEGMYCLLQEV